MEIHLIHLMILLYHLLLTGKPKKALPNKIPILIILTVIQMYQKSHHGNFQIARDVENQAQFLLMNLNGEKVLKLTSYHLVQILIL
mgnify:CR=1 FL=1